MPSLSEWSETVGLLRGLWPAWKPTSAQAEQWQHKLANLAPEAVRDAIRCHYNESRWREPKLPEILEHFRVMFPSRPTVTSTPADDAAERTKYQDECVEVCSKLMAMPQAELLALRNSCLKRFRFLNRNDSPLGNVDGNNHSSDPGHWTEWLRRTVWIVKRHGMDPREWPGAQSMGTHHPDEARWLAKNVHEKATA